MSSQPAGRRILVIGNEQHRNAVLFLARSVYDAAHLPSLDYWECNPTTLARAAQGSIPTRPVSLSPNEPTAPRKRRDEVDRRPIDSAAD